MVKMNDTEKILDGVSTILLHHNLIKNKNVRQLANYFNLSHTILYKQINSNRLSLKMYKNIKIDPYLKNMEISNNYIINNILMGI